MLNIKKEYELVDNNKTKSVKCIKSTSDETDNFEKSHLKKYMNGFIKLNEIIEEINKDLGDDRKEHKLIRKINFPSEISENIVKFYFKKNKNANITWNTSVGDLKWDNDRIEVKGFSSDGPSSFGPTETWDKLVFIDCRNYKNNKIKIILINLKNSDDAWKNIILNNGKNNKPETYEDQCKAGRRPRITYEMLKRQIDSKYLIEGEEFDIESL